MADAAEPEDHQEQHSATEGVMIRVATTRVTQRCRRRKADCRVWDSMTPEQERAAEAIGAAFRIISAGMGSVTMRYDEQTSRGSGEGSQDKESARQITVSRYFEWGAACLPQGISHAAIMDILAYGLSLTQVDAGRRKRKGWAKENLLDGLSLYVKKHRL